jgi:hypothetical protein
MDMMSTYRLSNVGLANVSISEVSNDFEPMWSPAPDDANLVENQLWLSPKSSRLGL